MPHKILAVQNCGPSGSTLVQSLLDDHPSIMSLPALHALELVIFWESFCALPFNEFYEKFINHFKFYFKPDLVPNGLGLRELGDHQDELACVDEAVFTQKLKAYFQKDTLTFKSYLVAVFRAYHESLGKPYSNDSYILYPIHSLNKRFAKILVDNFDCVRFLYTVREPVQAIGSAAKHINKDRAWDHLHLLTCISAQMICDYTIHVGPHDVYGMRPYFLDTPNRSIESRAIRLEDVHRSTKNVMEKVCVWLDIPWNNSLTVSTFNGKKWHNRPESIRQSGVGTATLKQDHGDILTKLDKYRFDFLAKKFKQHFNYESNFKKTNRLFIFFMIIFFPFKMERISSRKENQLRQFKINKKNRRLTRYIPDFFDGFIVTVRNIVLGYQCRKQWIIPAMLGKHEAVQSPYVELL
jgi:hypothetical protein